MYSSVVSGEIVRHWSLLFITMVMFISPVAGFGRIVLGVAVSRVLWSRLWCFLPDSVNRLRFRCSIGRRCARVDLFDSVLAVVALFPIFVYFLILLPCPV